MNNKEDSRRLKLLSGGDTFVAKVLERDSRVTVRAQQAGQEYRTHLRNTGKLEEIIYPGVPILCQWKKGGKTDARCLASLQEGSWVLLDTRLQEEGFAKGLEKRAFPWFPQFRSFSRQVTCSGSRLDFEFETGNCTGFIELKSAVTCQKGWASYPDAESIRGLEHLKLLTRLSRRGVPVYVAFAVSNPNCRKFRPNSRVQPEMSQALKTARQQGVGVFAVLMTIEIDGSVWLEDSNLSVNL